MKNKTLALWLWLTIVIAIVLIFGTKNEELGGVAMIANWILIVIASIRLNNLTE